ncbi:uncharacterized protein LOC119192838, partial [Manduca sexta]|uniref:uncharacterized protein LOC119192838 n=1 Tax=Manduca sexta TaxID=7130 RepID=UPI00188E987E
MNREAVDFNPWSWLSSANRNRSPSIMDYFFPPSRTLNNATATTYKPTKHYTIRPVVRTTETPTVQETDTTLNSDSTETVSVIDTPGTTIEGPKETA